MSSHLSTQTSIFDLHLWIVLGVSAGAIFVLLLFLLSLWFTNRSPIPQSPNPNSNSNPNSNPNSNSITTPTTSHRLSAIEQQALLKHDEEHPRNHIQMGKGHPHRVLYPKRFAGETPIGNGSRPVTAVGPEVSHLGWGHWYTLRELELATNGFAAENVIGQGGYGIVYL